MCDPITFTFTRRRVYVAPSATLFSTTPTMWALTFSSASWRGGRCSSSSSPRVRHQDHPIDLGGQHRGVGHGRGRRRIHRRRISLPGQLGHDLVQPRRQHLQSADRQRPASQEYRSPGVSLLACKAAATVCLPATTLVKPPSLRRPNSSCCCGWRRSRPSGRPAAPSARPPRPDWPGSATCPRPTRPRSPAACAAALLAGKGKVDVERAIGLGRARARVGQSDRLLGNDEPFDGPLLHRSFKNHPNSARWRQSQRAPPSMRLALVRPSGRAWRHAPAGRSPRQGSSRRRRSRLRSTTTTSAGCPACSRSRAKTINRTRAAGAGARPRSRSAAAWA